jgi:transcriptional regulator with XRE-family HTH domain
MIDDVRKGLRTIIKNGAYNQTALAKKVGLSPSQLSGILSLNRKLDANEMFALCDVLNVRPEHLRDPDLYQNKKTS